MRRYALSLALCLFVASPALAQDDPWKLGDSIRELTDRERDDLKKLPGELADLPLDVLKAFLKDEGKHIESITNDDIDAFTKEAKIRFKANGSRHLLRSLEETFESLKITSKRVLAIVFKEEVKRLESMPDELFKRTLAEAFKRVLGDRLRRMSHISLDVVKANDELNKPSPSWGWKTGTLGDNGRDSRLFKDLVVLAKEDNFVKTLFEKEVKGSFGTLRLTAAKVEGLANAKVGKLSIKDEFGKVHEGLGATFKVKTTFVVANAEAESKKLELIKDQPISVSAMLFAKILDARTNVELNSTNLITTDGLILHNELTAGATASASVRMPIDIDLSVFKVRITPYAEAHVGVGASAHANIEIEWSGRLAIDIGAAYSVGAGVGFGVKLEIMAGPLVEKLLARLERALVSFFRPIVDGFRGINEKGTAFESGKQTFTLEDLQRELKVSEAGARPKDAAALAARYAPVLYQRVKDVPHDYIRRINFDGDWRGNNNWDHSSSGDTKAVMYWDLKETESHIFITYAWFYARRESKAPLFLRLASRHENDLAGAMIVVNKSAPRFQEVQAVVSCSGSEMNAFSANPKDRWKATNNGPANFGWSGTVKFVDEVDHPNLDHERRHPQLYADARDHEVAGYNGRDDRDAFEGDTGVVYFYTGRAESPESPRDGFVGYALEPMSKILDQLGEKDVFSKGTVTLGPARLPEALRGEVGPDDQGTLPWAWKHEDFSDHTRGPRDNTRDRVEVVAPGALYYDPAGTLAYLFKMDGRFSRRYTRASMLDRSISSIGATGALRGR